MLRVYDLEDYLTLPAGLWGIREPGLAYSSATLPRQNGMCTLAFVKTVERLTRCIPACTQHLTGMPGWTLS